MRYGVIEPGSALPLDAQDHSQHSTESTPAIGALRAVLLLTGSVRPTSFDEAISRSPVHLPLLLTGGSASQGILTVLDQWQKAASDLRTFWPTLKLRVIGASATEGTRSSSPPDWVALEADPREYRGTAGLLRDLVADYADDDIVLVAPGRRVMMTSLLRAAREIGPEEITIFASRGEDAGLMAARVGILRRAKEVGFEDFREQFLPRLVGERCQVVLKDLPDFDSVPVRTAADYIAALRIMHQAHSASHKGLVGGDGSDELREEWRPTFSIVEPGAEIGIGARLFDSIVLAGAKVGPGAVLGRCVVGPRGVVSANARLLDALVVSRT